MRMPLIPSSTRSCVFGIGQSMTGGITIDPLAVSVLALVGSEAAASKGDEIGLGAISGRCGTVCMGHIFAYGYRRTK